jgi:hypothetical protein
MDGSGNFKLSAGSNTQASQMATFVTAADEMQPAAITCMFTSFHTIKTAERVYAGAAHFYRTGHPP